MSRVWRIITGKQIMKRLLATTILFGLVAGGALVGFLVSQDFTVDDALAALSAVFPQGATDVQFATQAAPTRIFWLRFSLDSADTAAPFWEQAGIIAPQPGFTPFPQPNPFETGLTWWQPRVATYSGSYTNTGAYIIEVLVDHSAPTRVTVYLRAYAL